MSPSDTLGENSIWANNRFRDTEGVEITLLTSSKYGGPTFTCLASLSDKYMCSGHRLYLFSKFRGPNVHGFLSFQQASLLTCWLPPTIAQLTTESGPPISAERDNVLMFVHNMPENVQVFSWFTGVMVLKSHEISRYVVATSSCVLEPTHSGRETAVNNGSLLIKMSPGKTRGSTSCEHLVQI